MKTNRLQTLINKEYEERRRRNAEEEERRLQEALGKCPGLHELLEKRHRMILGAAKSMFSAMEKDPEKLMKEYNEHIRSLLKENGFPEDWLQPVYICPNCRDTGYISVNPSIPCACFTEIRNHLASESLSGADEQTFEHFDPTVFSDAIIPEFGKSQRETALNNRDQCFRYLDSLPTPRRSVLMLQGGSGLGKTFLMNCIAEGALKKGIDVITVSAYRMLSDLKNAYFERDDNDCREYFECSLLCVDDLGMEPLMQNITIEQIYNLFNERFSRNLPTVITTNLTLQDIKARYNERLFSRFSDRQLCQILPMIGKDIRSSRHSR